MNRITTAVALTRSRLASLDDEALARVRAEATLRSTDLDVVATWPARAHAAGALTFAEAETLADLRDHFGKVDVASRIVFLATLRDIADVTVPAL